MPRRSRATLSDIAGTLRLLRKRRKRGTWKKYDYRFVTRTRDLVSSRGLWLRMNYWEKAGRRQVSPTTEDHFSV